MQPLRDDRIFGTSLRCWLWPSPSSQDTIRIILQDQIRSFWIILDRFGSYDMLLHVITYAAGLSLRLVSRAAKLCRVPFSLEFSCAAAHLGRHWTRVD